MRFASTLVVSVGLLAGCASVEKQEQSAGLLTPEHFRDTATVKDDRLETVATITTVNGYQLKQGLLDIVWNDHFLRAFVDKRSGKVRYQLYQVIYYRDAWRYYTMANYETSAGPQSVEATVISRDVLSCSGSSGCTFVEHVAFDIPESVLRDVAARGVGGEWSYKFKSKAGIDFPSQVIPAEAAGLMMRVSAYEPVS